jgi:hypothetical protein
MRKKSAAAVSMSASSSIRSSTFRSSLVGYVSFRPTLSALLMILMTSLHSSLIRARYAEHLEQMTGL